MQHTHKQTCLDSARPEEGQNRHEAASHVASHVASQVETLVFYFIRFLSKADILATFNKNNFHQLQNFMWRNLKYPIGALEICLALKPIMFGAEFLITLWSSSELLIKEPELIEIKLHTFPCVRARMRGPTWLQLAHKQDRKKTSGH